MKTRMPILKSTTETSARTQHERKRIHPHTHTPAFSPTPAIKHTRTHTRTHIQIHTHTCAHHTDTPGNSRYDRASIGALALCDVVVLVLAADIDIETGKAEEYSGLYKTDNGATRVWGTLLAGLGYKQRVVVCVTKLDAITVESKEERYHEVVRQVCGRVCVCVRVCLCACVCVCVP